MVKVDSVAPGNEKDSVAQANLIYFQALAHSRASLTGLGALAFVTMFMLGLCTGTALNSLVFFQGVQQYVSLFVAHVVVLGLLGIVVLVSPFKTLLYRFQVFFSAAFAAVAALMVYGLCMMGVVLSSFDGVRGEGSSPVLFAVVGAAAAVLLAGAVGVQVWLLRRRLRVGHSEERTMGNFQAVTRGSRARTFWITFPLLGVLAVGNVLTRGQFLANTVGLVLLPLFIIGTSSLPVECVYLAVLKSRDRRYWEKPPRRKRRQRRTNR